MAETRIILDDFLPYRLSVASNAVSKLIARAYEERFQLTIPEWRLMAVLAEQGRATPLELARRTQMDKITVSRAAKRLQARNFVAASPNAADRRSHFLALTAKGGKLYAEVAPLALDIGEALIRNFSAEEVSVLRDLLERVAAAALDRG